MGAWLSDFVCWHIFLPVVVVQILVFLLQILMNDFPMLISVQNLNKSSSFIGGSGSISVQLYTARNYFVYCYIFYIRGSYFKESYYETLLHVYSCLVDSTVPCDPWMTLERLNLFEILIPKRTWTLRIFYTFITVLWWVKYHLLLEWRLWHVY